MDKLIEENKVVTIIAICLVLASGYYYSTSSQAKGQMDSQSKCSAQAKIFFDYFVTDPQEKQVDEYTNHYNSKLDKCFILIKHGVNDSSEPGVYTKDFYDVIEKKEYGSYLWKLGKDNMNPPIDCSIYPGGNQESLKTCNSGGEFDAFVNTYMQD